MVWISLKSLLLVPKNWSSLPYYRLFCSEATSKKNFKKKKTSKLFVQMFKWVSLALANRPRLALCSGISKIGEEWHIGYRTDVSLWPLKSGSQSRNRSHFDNKSWYRLWARNFRHRRFTTVLWWWNYFGLHSSWPESGQIWAQSEFFSVRTWLADSGCPSGSYWPNWAVQR